MTQLVHGCGMILERRPKEQSDFLPIVAFKRNTYIISYQFVFLYSDPRYYTEK